MIVHRKMVKDNHSFGRRVQAMRAAV